MSEEEITKNLLANAPQYVTGSKQAFDLMVRKAVELHNTLPLEERSLFLRNLCQHHIHLTVSESGQTYTYHRIPNGQSITRNS